MNKTRFIHGRAKRTSPVITLLLGILLTAGASLGPATEEPPVDRKLVDEVIEKLGPSVVRIHVVSASYYDGRSHKHESSGSGVIISPDGTIVTNHHVAGDAVRLVCTLNDRRELPAELIGTDAMSDISVIKLTPEEPTEYHAAPWGDSDGLRVGDRVWAMGSPLSLSQSVTEGIVSNTAMTMPSRWGYQFRLDGENVGSIVRWIGHDADIFPGNSGGPLLNFKGEIIGINEISFGLGGAIPGNLAREVVTTLIEHGEVERAFIGAMLQPIFKKDGGVEGVVVSDVVKGSPAEEGGVEAGDRLISVTPGGGEGEPIMINIQFHEELAPLNLKIASLPIDEEIDVKLTRGDEEMVKKLTPVSREAVRRKRREFKKWGLTGRDLSTWTALEMKRDNKEGLLVTSVRPGGPVGQAKPPIQGRDVIIEVDGKPVPDTKTFAEISAQLTKDQTEPVPALVKFARKGEELITVVKVGLDELDDPGRQVRKAWLPIATQVLTRDLAEKLGLEGETGVRVTQLYGDEDSTDTLGLRVGDVILYLDDEPILASEPHDTEVFPTMLRQYKIGTEATLAVVRDGEEIELTGALPGRPPEPREMNRYKDHDFEFTVRDVAYIDRRMKQWEDEVRGVYVESVASGSWAALGRLGDGDLLLEIEGQPMREVDDVEQALKKIVAERPSHVIFKILRGIHTRYIEIEPLWDEET